MVTGLLLIITALLWGATPILEKLGLAKTDPLTAVSIRTISVAVILLVFLAVTGRIKEVMQVDARTVIIFVVSGLMAGVLGMLTYFGALKLEPTSKIVPIVAAYPLITVILSVLILKEGVTLLRLAGTILIILGIWLVK